MDFLFLYIFHLKFTFKAFLFCLLSCLPLLLLLLHCDHPQGAQVDFHSFSLSLSLSLSYGKECLKRKIFEEEQLSWKKMVKNTERGREKRREWCKTQMRLKLDEKLVRTGKNNNNIHAWECQWERERERGRLKEKVWTFLSFMGSRFMTFRHFKSTKERERETIISLRVDFWNPKRERERERWMTVHVKEIINV